MRAGIINRVIGDIHMDFAALATAANVAIVAALTAITPVVAVVIGASVGYKLIRKFLG